MSAFDVRVTSDGLGRRTSQGAVREVWAAYDVRVTSDGDVRVTSDGSGRETWDGTLVWPSGLPQSVDLGTLQRSFISQRVGSDLPGKEQRRRRSRGLRLYAVSFQMTLTVDQKKQLDRFFTDVAGVKSFMWHDLVSLSERQFFRFVTPPQYQARTGAHYVVDISLKRTR